ncbi:MAG: phage tail sheath family protein [Verrucomicrobiota bacterium]
MLAQNYAPPKTDGKMPNYFAPGVFMEEIGVRNRVITGVPTSVAALVGLASKGPFAANRKPKLISSFAEFQTIYGGTKDLAQISPKTNYLAYAVRNFFDEGGKQIYIARVKSKLKRDWENAMRVVASWNVSIIAAPGSTEFGSVANAIQKMLVAQAEAPNAYRIAVLELPKGKTPAEASVYAGQFKSDFVAFYYPWITVANPNFKAGDPVSPKNLTLPPSGFLCGLYAKNDHERGVFKSPANLPVISALGFERNVSSADQDLLNLSGVNSLRTVAGRGNLVWGAGTSSANPEWKYVSVRRYFTYLQQSIQQGTRWVCFEPDDAKLWALARNAISDFLLLEWRNGALPGTKPEEAFFVRCDRTTMTQDDINRGRLICEIGVAAVKPAEFVIFRIGQWTADAKDKA